MKRVCGWHGKTICPICDTCEECGLYACIHTKNGRKMRVKFEKMKAEGIEYIAEIKR